MNLEALKSTAVAMVGNGKGILAADESTPTLGKRFDTINTESTAESRRRYREMLFTAEGANKYIGGVILFDETLRQSTSAGVPFPKYLEDLGIVPGIKVDSGAKSLAAFQGETVTEGLDGLRERLKEYYKLGARFTKWRGVYKISKTFPKLTDGYTLKYILEMERSGLTLTFVTLTSKLAPTLSLKNP